MTLTDAALAARLASEAGDLLLGVSRSMPVAARIEHRRAAGDAAAQSFLAGELARLRPGDAVLSEEAPDHGARLDADRVWIIDPLDGTREFAEGRGDWAVHVALWERDRPLTGAVALPSREVTLVSSPPPKVPTRSPDGPLLVAVSRTRAPAVADRLAARDDVELVPMGSAGAKVASVVLGDNDAYVHAGGQYEWDSAAPVAVALAAGLHASRLDGTPLRYNSRNPYLPDLLVCRPELADTLIAACAGSPDPAPVATRSVP